MKTLFKLLAIAFIFASCEDTEPIIYNGNYEQNDTYISFSRSVYLLPIVQNSTGEVNVVFNASTVTDTDRVYDIEIGFPDNSSAANPATFTVPSTVTILAGSYQGFFTISGVDNDLVDETNKTFTMTITNADETFEYSDSLTATVNIYEVCPLQSDFTGTYYMEVAENYFTDLPGFEAGEVVLAEGSTPYERVFAATAYPGYGGSEEVIIAFACNYLNLGEKVASGVACADDPDDSSLTFAPADLEDRSAYNTNDDSYFEMTVIENSTSNCGGGPQNTIIKFTKVN
ncbi:hypothetical protein DVK85_00845 [Flavobacterium arcticum]|uniref:DUF4843 domain-containing protein n=1 Tax=Flavobacterium arcticum TaxID=1784713 RepID=A0A345H8E4_9FLAO|nr:hypothetical protein [Flavobacterium arcticum]AXG72854.1 hypothetical protein DVK85_00845 [Flavobacterium arcticum]KAF2510481.1 hypothetical protein E0W72_08360 [Flavobacterium arcticum]